MRVTWNELPQRIRVAVEQHTGPVADTTEITEGQNSDIAVVLRLGADGVVHVIDWGFPGAGAPWVDAAFLVLRLVEAGHHPDGAEAWARSLTCWSGVDRQSLTAFAVYVAGMWTYWAVTDNARGAGHRARLARGYTTWRLASLPPTFASGRRGTDQMAATS